MATPSDVVAERVREVRKKNRMTVAQLAERCAELGVPELTEQAIYNLEAGRRDRRRQGLRRRAVTVDELLVLALALHVAPVHLLVPTENSDAGYQVTPSVTVDSDQARAWMRGFAGLDGTDLRGFYFEVPAHELAGTEPHRARVAFEEPLWYWLQRTIGPGRLVRRRRGSNAADWILQEPEGDEARESTMADFLQEPDGGETDG
jgi:transcriptional regulator with XRE-family HTH domain